jgi:hypothetical protein
MTGGEFAYEKERNRALFLTLLKQNQLVWCRPEHILRGHSQGPGSCHRPARYRHRVWRYISWLVDFLVTWQNSETSYFHERERLAFLLFFFILMMIMDFQRSRASTHVSLDHYFFTDLCNFSFLYIMSR